MPAGEPVGRLGSVGVRTGPRKALEPNLTRRKHGTVTEHRPFRGAHDRADTAKQLLVIRVIMVLFSAATDETNLLTDFKH